jgi:hypothetical protein
MDENISYGPVAGTVIDFIVVETRYRDFAGDSPLDNARDRWQVYAGIATLTLLSSKRVGFRRAVPVEPPSSRHGLLLRNRYAEGLDENN